MREELKIIKVMSQNNQIQEIQKIWKKIEGTIGFGFDECWVEIMI